MSAKTKTYIQSLVLKKTLDSISFDRRRGIEKDDGHYEVEALANKITAAQTEVEFVETQQATDSLNLK